MTDHMTASTRILVVPTSLGALHVHTAGPAAGPTALLWPSLFSDGQTSWGAQLPGLHELGWQTLLVDPPGTGQSTAVTRLFSMEECGEAAVAVLDAAGVDQAAVLGLSWGGFVGLRVALAAPQRVTGLVLSNTSARRMSFPERQRDRLTANLVRVGIPGGPGRLVVAGMLSESSRSNDPAFAADFAGNVNQLDKAGLARAMRSVLADRSSVVDTLSRITAPALVIAGGVNQLDKAGLARAMRSVLADRSSVVEALGRITAPVLVIAGGEDSAFPLVHAQELAERIPGARLEVLPHVGHLAPREAPDAVAGLLKSFLANLTRKEHVDHE